MSAIAEAACRTALALLEACWEDTGYDVSITGRASWAVHPGLYMDLQRAALRRDNSLYTSGTGVVQHVIRVAMPDAAGDRGKRNTNIELCTIPAYPDRDVPEHHIELRWARRAELR